MILRISFRVFAMSDPTRFSLVDNLEHEKPVLDCGSILAHSKQRRPRCVCSCRQFVITMHADCLYIRRLNVEDEEAALHTLLRVPRAKARDVGLVCSLGSVKCVRAG